MIFSPIFRFAHYRAGSSILALLFWGGILFPFPTPVASATPPIPATEMVFIPAGDFTMGSTEEDIMWAAKQFFSESLEYYRDETPAHPVTLEKYEIDKTEVTVGQYKLYMEKTGKSAPKFMDNERFNGNFQPVVGITWQEANDYCVWNGKRLPTEAEWERAARGTDGRYYPWGSDPDPSRSNARGKKDGYHYSSPVGTFANGVSPSGTLDMAGNVWEWTADWYDGYPGTTHQSDMFGKNYKVIKGGSWFSNLDLARSAVRGKMSPDRRQNYIGFRCVR